MLEAVGDIFNQPDADGICVTTNGILCSKGNLVMGAGIAKAFKIRWPVLPKYFGQKVKESGNHVYAYNTGRGYIFSFPTKHHWKNPSDIKLVEQSARELEKLTYSLCLKKVCLPRPGCVLGGLDWINQVKPLIAAILDNRFVIITRE